MKNNAAMDQSVNVADFNSTDLPLVKGEGDDEVFATSCENPVHLPF